MPTYTSGLLVSIVGSQTLHKLPTNREESTDKNMIIAELVKKFLDDTAGFIAFYQCEYFRLKVKLLIFKNITFWER